MSTAWPGTAGAGAAGGRTAVVAGASGLVGREILQGLLADDTVTAVLALGRRPLQLQHPKLTSHAVDFAALPALPAASEVYLALGTTIKVAGSERAFRAVDHDANLAVARAAFAAGTRHLGLVSAMGADVKSPLFYNRVKGETETDVAALGFDGVVFARPSFLAGDRESLGQPVRGGEKLAMRISQWLKPVLPSNYRSIAAADVAHALLANVPTTVGRQVLLSGAMNRS